MQIQSISIDGHISRNAAGHRRSWRCDESWGLASPSRSRSAPENASGSFAVKKWLENGGLSPLIR